MANPLRGEARIGKSQFVVVFEANALCEIREYFGDLDRGLARIDAGDLDLFDQRAVLFAALRRSHPGMTLLGAGDIITEHPADVLPALRLALHLALPEPSSEKKDLSPAETDAAGLDFEKMHRAHIAAGLDPETFWTLTPREWLLRLQGAEDAERRRRATLAQAGWMAQHSDADGLTAYVRELFGGEKPQLTAEGVDRMLNHTAAGLTEMSMEEYLGAQGGCN